MSESSWADFDFEGVACSPHGIGPNRPASRAAEDYPGFQIKTGSVRPAYKGVVRHDSSRQRNPIMRTGVTERIHLFTQSKNRDFSASNDNRFALAVGKIVQRAERNPHGRRWGQRRRR